MQGRSFRARGLGALPLAIALVANADDADPLRLTHEVEPLAQAVTLTLDPNQPGYTGETRIDLTVNAATSTIRLHAQDMELGKIEVRPAAGGAGVTPRVATGDLGLLTLTLPAPLEPGSYTLTIAFSNDYNANGNGLYKHVHQDDAYLYTQFEDRYARQAFPCFDEPEFKIPWRMTVVAPDSVEVIGNYPVALESREADRKRVQFGRTPPLPTYLVALAVGPFDLVPVPEALVPSRVVTARGQGALAAEAVRMTPPLLRALERYFQVPYPYAKLDHIAASQFNWGGMENAGAIVYRDSALLLDPEQASFSQRANLAGLTAHEMAHMWFGDLVTMRWWDDIWLNESFASWMGDKIAAQVYPQFRMEYGQLAVAHNAMRTDALPSVTPIRRKVLASDDLDRLFDELSYDKGQAILQMVESWVGPDRFRAAMREYFLRHRWGNTSADDLWAAFDSVADTDVSAMLSAFIERPGVPLVTLEPLGGDRLRLSQRRFANLGAPAPEAVRWQVPINIAYSVNGQVRRERVLLKDESTTIELPGSSSADWIYPNAGESGYYRWSMPAAQSQRLASTAASVLAPRERYGFLDNLAALLRAGKLAGNEYLRLISGFAADPEPEIVSKVIEGMDEVRITFIDDESLPDFNRLQSEVLRPALDRIGLEPQAAEPEHVAPLRSYLLATLGAEPADQQIIEYARKLADAQLQDPRSVDPALALASLRVAAYHGDTVLVDAYSEALEKAVTPLDRRNFLLALGGFHEPAAVEKALDYALKGLLTPNEFLSIPQGLAGDPTLQPVLVDWLIANIDAVKSRAPSRFYTDLVYLADGADVALLDRLLAAVLAPGRATQSAEVEAAKVRDRVALRVRLREKEQANVTAFLNEP